MGNIVILPISPCNYQKGTGQMPLKMTPEKSGAGQTWNVGYMNPQNSVCSQVPICRQMGGETTLSCHFPVL